MFYELTPAPSGSWTETVLFEWGVKVGEGGYPGGDLTVDGSGNVYGTTAGTVYELQRPNWTESTLAVLDTMPTGTGPGGGVIFDGAGNLYGATNAGGDGPCGIVWAQGCGVVYELSPRASGGAWTETLLYNFTGSTDGGDPVGRLAFDAAGRLHGDDAKRRVGKLQPRCRLRCGLCAGAGSIRLERACAASVRERCA